MLHKRNLPRKFRPRVDEDVLERDSNVNEIFFFRYEPELFPGLVYRMQKPKIVLLIFVSGKIVLTGKHFHAWLHFLLWKRCYGMSWLAYICAAAVPYLIVYFSSPTGAKVREEIYQAFNNIYPILKNFMKLDSDKSGLHQPALTG